ncbi:hypothetical protein JTE90_017773 [Oedothorax gibbosus]|uniref:Uncharacterized protein n=1 Tax=Oedothorax gibbosus TaxID=931172 RepID=A0AAV6UL77_9ARAC|nr:hypothetical protein JTE90_017773 [Oedothorax gibbosus]
MRKSNSTLHLFPPLGSLLSPHPPWFQTVSGVSGGGLGYYNAQENGGILVPVTGNELQGMFTETYTMGVMLG